MNAHREAWATFRLRVGTHCDGPGRIDQRRCYSAVSRNLPPKYFSGFTGQDADRAAVDICAPIAIEAVKRIDELFAIEREIDGLTPQRRFAIRHERSRPLSWPSWRLGCVSNAPESSKNRQSHRLQPQALERAHPLPR
jgi:hypothetical protein